MTIGMADCNECGDYIPISEGRYCHDCNAFTCNDCFGDHTCDPLDMDDDIEYFDEDEQ